MTPLVSIITPSYNQAAYLEQTLLSVLNQDYPAIEYIVIDGASTDGSADIIRRYADRLSYWVSEPDRGQSHAINKGFARARGEIVAWMNSDDLYTPGAVAEAVALLTSRPDVGMVYGNCLRIDADSAITSWHQSRQHDLIDLLSFSILSQPAVFLRRELVERVGGLDESLHMLFDHLLWLRAAAQVPILYHDRYWACAREHAEAKNFARWQKFGEEATLMLNMLERDPDFSEIIDAHRPQIWAGRARFAGTYLAAHGEARAALREFTTAYRLHPKTMSGSGPLLAMVALGGTGLLRSGDSFRLFQRLRRRAMRRPEVAVWPELH